MRMKVEEAMQDGVALCTPDTTVAELAKKMRDDGIGVIAIGQNNRVIGMVTDRDLACRGLAEGDDVAMLTARDVMTKGVAFCRFGQELEEAIDIMKEQRERRVPVL